jgi:uncharacterized protein (DUF1778 family)
MASLTPHPESARLNCRISATIKQRAEEAAQLLGQSITAFTEAALAEKSREVLEQNEKITLSQRDFDKFVAAINEPPVPTPALARAMRRYEEQREGEPNGNW